MRHKTAQLMRKSGLFALFAALLSFGAPAVRAQLPVFDGIDWITDRGAIHTGTGFGVPNGVNAGAERPGYNNYLIMDPPGGPPSSISVLNNNPGLAVPRWVFPRTSDLRSTPTTPVLATITVDNATRSYDFPGGAYAVPPAPTPDDPDYPNGDYVSDTLGNRVRAMPLPPGVFVDGSYNPQQLAHMRYISGAVNWTLPDVLPFDPADYRSPSAGYSFNSDYSLPWDYDYAFTPAVYNPILIRRADGTQSSATMGEIAALPGGTQDVVSAINNVLTSTPQLRAFYSMGAYNAAAGQYSVDVYMPGSGTIIGGDAHPSIQRAFVRVSWGTSAADGVNNTINADGSFNVGPINRLANSRIFVVNMDGAGWYRLAAPGQFETGIPYDGTPADQIVVELYTITPDITNPGDPNSPYQQTPVITCDAVRFRPITNPSAPGLGLGSIAANGRILAPAAGTPKFNSINSAPRILPTEQLPLVYFGREEVVPDPSVLVLRDPTLPYDPNPADPLYNPLVPDPTATKTVSVFYCIDNQNGDAVKGLPPTQITSIDKVRWRYVGLPDANDQLVDGSSTTISAPLIANVRCRDGVVRPMVYFTTTNADGSLGRIYAFDPVGDRTQLTTDLYWVYPSYRPIQATDVNTNAELSGVYYEYHDPNYKNTSLVGPSAFGLHFVPGAYPITTFGNPAVADQAMGFDFYYDGEISSNPAQPGAYQISANNTKISGMGGVTASPTLIDDPGNINGPQLLMVPNSNGRIYAFDAGGRGDYAPISGANPVPGTTQRLWTYPHFGADAFHRLALNTFVNGIRTNIVQDDAPKGGFVNTPAYDPNYVVGNPAGDPLFTPSEDGYLYAINPIRDAIGIPNILGSQHANWNDTARLNWQYPGPNASPLNFPGGISDMSTPTLFTTSGLRKVMYFTALGRVYCLPEFSLSNVNAVNWIFPFTNNPPFTSDPNDTATFNFASMPPVAVNLANLPGAIQDELYVLDATATLLMLDPLGGLGTTTVQAAGQSFTGSFTTSVPILSQLQAQPDFSANGAIGTSQPALVFGDSLGTLWGLEAIPEIVNGVPTFLPIWGQFDSTQGRDANVVLANGMLISGSEDGQLRAYGVGSGPFQDQGSLGTGEPQQNRAGVGELSIDLRVIDLYSSSDWGAMMLGPTGVPPNPPGARRTPLKDENGNNLTNSANPITANVAGGIEAVDWGDYLYVAVAGVYHAHPTTGVMVQSTDPPQINVTFTLTQSNGKAVTYPIGGVPLRAPGFLPGQGATPSFWPDDLAITAGEHTNLKIYGLDSDTGTFRTLTGSPDNVYPWAAKIRIPIEPSLQQSFAPGGSYKLTAQATIQQDIVGMPSTSINSSNFLGVGQTNWKGFDLTPAVPGGSIPVPNPSRLGNDRQITITNPIGLTVRSFAGNGNNDESGANMHNIIGWFGSVLNGANSIGEVLGNGNLQSVPGVVAAGSVSPYKALFAPIGSVNDGSSKTYKAIDATRQSVDALYVVDRSALGRITGKKSFPIQVVTQAPHWYGGPSSVMNPLPWEILPTNTTASKDYPSLDGSMLTVTTGSGQDAIHTYVQLNPPIYHDKDPIGNPNPDPADDYKKGRRIVPTMFLLNVQVPKYQPANVNRGLTSWTLMDGNNFAFGQGFTGIDGVIHGANLNAVNDPVIGPVQTTTGDPVAPNDPLASPAAGYIAGIQVKAAPPTSSNGVSAPAQSNRLTLLLGRSGTNVASEDPQASREFAMGLTVPPNIRLRTQETTVDLGKLPHGAGYGAGVLDGLGNQAAFAPSNSARYPYNANGVNLPNQIAPWDDPNNPNFLQMFRQFTLISDSNVNLINLRAAKLVGQNDALIISRGRSIAANVADPPPHYAVALRLGSDQVNNISVSPLIAPAFLDPNNFPQAAGNLGIVTSFDHMSRFNNPFGVNPNFAEQFLWPITNPYVFQQDIAAINAVNFSLIATNSFNQGVFGWSDALQPTPTIGKPRIGDSNGHTATIPDMPHDAVNPPQTLVPDPLGTFVIGGVHYKQISYFTLPEIGMAVPIGTPVGTYSVPVNIFEDNTPPQWQEWLAKSAEFQSGRVNDAILNVTPNNSPNEVHTDPTFDLKLTVREARLTEGYTSGDVAQIDGAGSNPFIGANLMPAAFMAPGQVTANSDTRQLWLYWATNRQPGGATPNSNQPWGLAVSQLSAPYSNDLTVFPPSYGDFIPAAPGQWWQNAVLFTGYGAAGPPAQATPAYLFPMNSGEATAASVGVFTPEFLGGTRSVPTMRMSNPAVTASLDFSGGYGLPNVADKEAYLFWTGWIDKFSAGNFGGGATVRDVRTFYQPIGRTPDPTAGAPIGPTFSMLNDPALIKMSPKPLLVKLPAAATPTGPAPARKFLFLFWHSGNSSSTQIYYNVASNQDVNIAFRPNVANFWSHDTPLPLPGNLASESDPYPTYRHVTVNGIPIDAIDVSFTGVLKNRQKVEILLARYAIDRTGLTTGSVGGLYLLPLPQVTQETLTRVGTTNTFAARDAFWGLGSGLNGTLQSNDFRGLITIDFLQGGGSPVPSHLNYKFKLDPMTHLFVPGSSPTTLSGQEPQIGTVDPASGLVTYDALSIDDNGNPVAGLSGGQITVDVKAGTVSFPQVAPQINDTVLVTYQPYIMRLSTSRDETNVVRTALPVGWAGDRAFATRPAANSPGSNSVPVTILDRGPNPRWNLTAPKVMFTASAPELDRMWVLYRKSDPSGSVKSTIYYKALRLMVKLPRPFLLTPADPVTGKQQLASLPVIGGGLVGPYEVDWVRGRLYFTEVDEGRPITVTYQYYDAATNSSGTATNLPYVIAWGDEMSSASSTGDETVPENPLPTDQAVSEGQVAAFKDPYLDKLWIFWTSTRSNTTDLYYETIAPQLYPTASNQQ